MEHFKFILDKSSKKFICPNCNKRTFVLFVDSETGNYLPDHFGRCDRSTNCHYFNAPPRGKKAFHISFLALRSISNKAYKLTDCNGNTSIVPKSQVLEQSNKDCWITEWFLKGSSILYQSNESKYFNTDKIEFVNMPPTKETVPQVMPSFHSGELLYKMYIENPRIDNLTLFLEKHFSKQQIFNAKQDYFISSTDYFWKNSTAFFQIDKNEKIRGCKIIPYDGHTGKRYKKPDRVNWLHCAIKEPNFVLDQCLFGLHLINEHPLKTIAIVEAEKTAYVMSIFIPDFIWLATGSSGNFNIKLLKAVKHRDIVAFPDKGEYDNWLNKSIELNSNGFKIAVSEFIETSDYPKGTDLADVYLDSNTKILL
ncbi:DUF6371 domain-containing protein [Flavobacterium sp. 245]|uniref:DUF6371 domain-containing protein n=1 Tax=Flavobacterium sp. 245 TaxID=2512115 RepID=UPI00105F267C|nr:DUF6371 domain-containing protein [Flavobacterium sp. 245]TDP02198.1 hypothetical protein EV145_103179 [Flavobacterium sp. 245]